MVAESVKDAASAARDDEAGLLCVVGPTASGKTALAVRLGEALGGEIVSCDSVQIYRRFDIGAGKPDADDLARVPHHLVSSHDPLDPVDAARFAEEATALILSIRRRGRLPILCGGTFLWTKAVAFGLAAAPGRDDALRAEHQALVAAEGAAALHARLAAVDPPAAERLHPNDVVRVSRALEVFTLSGRTLTAWHGEHRLAAPRFRPRLVGVRHDPDALTARIEARVAAMLAAGWLDEVRGLLEGGLGEARAMGSVGYREVHAHLCGRLPEAELAPAIVRATRVFARRQRTWLREQPVLWGEPTD